MVLAIMVWRHSAPLPFPTPAQQDLMVLTQPGVLTYDDSDPENVSGFEHDLVELFARELGVGVRYVVASSDQIPTLLKANRAHLAAAWLTPTNESTGQRSSPAFWDSHDILVQPEASLPIDDLSELAGRTIHVLAGSRQAATLRALQKAISDMKIVEVTKLSAFELLESVAARHIELAVADAAVVDVALQIAPSIQASLELGKPRPITWSFPDDVNPELERRANEFLARIRNDPAFARLKDRYFGHVRRLESDDIARLIELGKTTLPRLRASFQAAQIASGIDWRLLAALAYQESQWNSNATSPTGVRGIMMLTDETADRLGVSNRLDAEQSILAGARYLNILRQQMPADTPEPDRTWLALAAYNIGPGHFNAALTIGRQLGANTQAWHEMKRILPLLAKPQYYRRLKAGRARGGEAVILVENVRSFYDILSRHQSPLRSFRATRDSLPPAGFRPADGELSQGDTIFSSPPM
ncbi:MAG: membrane-bound lytic murein transglycosylase MltF [Betaproteobacteria bacterium]